MDEKKNFEENEKEIEINKDVDSILNLYSNIRQTNTTKNLIAQNNEIIFEELKKQEEKNSNIKEELDTLQNKLNQIHTITIKNINDLEISLTNKVDNIDEERKKEIDKLVQNLIKKIEENEKISEKQQKDLKEILENHIKDIESKNNKLNDSINTAKDNADVLIVTNIAIIRNEISKLEKDLLNKIKETEQNLFNNLEEDKKENEKLVNESISQLNIEKVKKSISNLEQENNKKIQKAENNSNEKIEQTKENINSCIQNNVEEIRQEISNLEKDILIKIQETEKKLLDTLAEDKKENKKLVNESISQLNIEEIKNSISNLETLNDEKIQELGNDINQKIDDLNYFDTIKNIENSLLELKERIINTECFDKSISKKVEELDSINQKKLDKVKKAQEKFIVQKISEAGIDEKINTLKNNSEEISKKINDLEASFNEVQEKSFSKMQDYIEKRILRMKFATTVQEITEEITELREEFETILDKKLKAQEQEFMTNIQDIIEEKVKIAIKEIQKKQKAKKENISIEDAESKIINTSHNTRKPKTKDVSSSLDEMVKTLQKQNTTKSKNTKSALNKKSKSQILNFNTKKE